MNKTVLAGLAAGLLVAVPAAPASAEYDFHLQGRRCEYSTAGDTGTGSYAVEIDAGPMLLVDRADPTVQRQGWITCTLQVGGPTHADADAVAVPGPTTATVLALAPTLVGYSGPPETFDDPATYRYLCTQVDVVDGPTLYWHDYNNPYTGFWTTSPGAHCQGGPQALGPCCPLPFEDEVDWLLEEFVGVDDVWIDVVDPVLCEPLADAFPPEGDVPGVWDCPPYGG